jgi:transcriptional regulator with XRE-family HTH domain
VGFVALQEGLRRELRRRIATGELTGTELARKTGFTQAHISNFINRKRGLKLGALDRMTKAIGLTIYDLLDPRELSRHVALPANNEGEFIDVPVVESAAAMNPIIVREQVQEILKFRRTFLNRLRASGSAARKDWTRFVAMQMDASEAAAMWPGSTGRVTVLIDRHYDSLEPYRSGKRNIYVVRTESGVLARYVEAVDGDMVLQPRDSSFPVTMLSGDAAAIVGRVAQASVKA